MNSSQSTSPRWFRCLAGSQARKSLTESGADPETFTLMLAASGGPRWLGLVGIDQALRGYLTSRRSRIPTLGASSGAWRLAALAADDDGQTYRELIHEYIEQRYEGRPTPEEVSDVCRDYLS
ncbi:MAG: alpha/beta hydrolase, partial [Candidatus Eremiobacteraeota bacterium]|nr:alpha/beta hydrolase [Candidatus Eremiobacteraeota bacterium]